MSLTSANCGRALSLTLKCSSKFPQKCMSCQNSRKICPKKIPQKFSMTSFWPPTPNNIYKTSIQTRRTIEDTRQLLLVQASYLFSAPTTFPPLLSSLLIMTMWWGQARGNSLPTTAKSNSAIDPTASTHLWLTNSSSSMSKTASSKMIHLEEVPLHSANRTCLGTKKCTNSLFRWEATSPTTNSPSAISTDGLNHIN